MVVMVVEEGFRNNCCLWRKLVAYQQEWRHVGVELFRGLPLVGFSQDRLRLVYEQLEQPYRSSDIAMYEHDHFSWRLALLPVLLV